MPGSREARIEALRGRIAAIEAGTRTPSPVLPFGDPRIDSHLPGGGLPRAGWHEVVGEGLEGESGAATAAFAALLARPRAAKGAVVWVLRRSDLYVPGLVNLGFPVERLVVVRVRDEAEGLSVLEDALGTPGVSVAIGEAEAPDLVAGRRLQLACERAGGFGVVLHRRPYGGPPRGATGSAAFSRWRVGPAPGRAPPDGQGGGLGLGPPAWRVALERCRGGRPGAWILEHSEADHGPHPFRVVSELADHDLAQTPPERLRRAG